ncbi:unnamed protein product [Acanthoscelides obtectus]|uniref:Uncharacterized protein n=1 Tax=Acanthoscelides obtectus TaxID=200917 RepID=A0A9P0MDM3_ACAOB|nr:unnamed protein product [Acanthoscelides obtectus]CAK1682605.1 hypothetical protein AOBTE_LOCUS33725 [Acanthoscelides obtectus]
MSEKESYTYLGLDQARGIKHKDMKEALKQRLTSALVEPKYPFDIDFRKKLINEMALTPAKKQRRYRLKLKLDPVKNDEAKRKHLERYHAKEKLVKDMTEREHRAANRRWKIANKKRRERQQLVENTPPSTPRSGTPDSPRCRGRKREELERLENKCNKYKKRYQRVRQHRINPDNNKYSTLSNDIRVHYKGLTTVKEKRALRQVFHGEAISKSKMKTAIVRGTFSIDQLKRKLTLSNKSGLVGKIMEFFNRDDVSRAIAGKRETVTYKKCVRKCEVIERSSNKVKITKNVKEIVEGTVPELTGRFNKTLRELKKHIFNITTQYGSYRDAMDNLKTDEIVLHIDFSENYSCKCFEEVQCHHFGGSRKRVTLHTGVMYTKTEGEVHTVDNVILYHLWK